MRYAESRIAVVLSRCIADFALSASAAYARPHAACLSVWRAHRHLPRPSGSLLILYRLCPQRKQLLWQSDRNAEEAAGWVGASSAETTQWPDTGLLKSCSPFCESFGTLGSGCAASCGAAVTGDRTLCVSGRSLSAQTHIATGTMVISNCYAEHVTY
jgi:hypothetical protein